MRTNSTINQKRSLLVKLFLRSFTALTLVFFSFAAFGQLAPVIKPTGGFAIDGGLKSNTPTAPTAAQPLPWLAPGQGDWFEGPAGAGGFVLNADRSAVEAGKSGYGTDPFSTNDNIFTNGSKFNDYIGALQWFTNSAPDKNDINNALYHVARDNSNNQWVFISGDRLSTNGTSYIDFELLQGSVTKTGITSGGFTGTPVADKPNGGGRTENDIIISMEYTNGGSKPIVRIYQWKLNNGTWSYKLVENLPANTAFAETNRYGAETGVPYSVFGSTNPSTYQQYAFVEAAVNISYLLSLAGEACSGLNISTLWVKTKASASSTAALKDFMDPIPVNFQFGSSSIVNPGPFCSNDTEPVTLSAEPSGGTFTINRNGVISSITTFTPSTEGPGSYPIRYSYSGCIANTIFVVESAATANASNPAAVCASSAAIQVVGTYGGGATGGQWSGGAGSFGTQEKDATAKTITATYTPTEAEIAAGTVQLTFTTTGQATPCAAATKNVTATINANPEAPEVEYIGPSCTETNFRVKVTSPVAGTYTLRQMKGGVAPMSRKYPEDAVDGKIIFEGLTIGKGYSVTHTANSCTSEPEKCGDFSGGYQEAEQVSAGQARVTDQEVVLRRVQKANVSAAPNPFNDRIRFTLKSDVSGQGTLELYNTLGQKVKTVFQGQVNAGQVQTIEYAVPSAQRTNLIYLFRVGDQTTTGKLVGLKQ